MLYVLAWAALAVFIGALGGPWFAALAVAVSLTVALAVAVPALVVSRRHRVRSSA